MNDPKEERIYTPYLKRLESKLIISLSKDFLLVSKLCKDETRLGMAFQGILPRVPSKVEGMTGSE